MRTTTTEADIRGQGYSPEYARQAFALLNGNPPPANGHQPALIAESRLPDRELTPAQKAVRTRRQRKIERDAERARAAKAPAGKRRNRRAPNPDTGLVAADVRAWALRDRPDLMCPSHGRIPDRVVKAYRERPQ